MIANDKALTSLEDIKSLGDIFVKSGFFADTRDASQAIVKILVGRELGLGPMASMIGVYIVNGRPALAANVMAAKVKASGRYDYRVLKQDNTACEIEFLERDDSGWHTLGISKFTAEDAKRAGTKNTEKYPRNMYFARAMSNGVKWYTPDITQGLTVYEPTELGAEVDEDGKMVNAKAVESAKPAMPSEKELTERVERMEDNQSPHPDAPFTPDPATAPTAHLPKPIRIASQDNGSGANTKRAQAELKAHIANYHRSPTPEQLTKMRGLLAGTLMDLLGSENARHMAVAAVQPDNEKGSVNAMTPADVGGWLEWLDLRKNGEGRYEPTDQTQTVKGLLMVVTREYLKAHGQQELVAA